MANAIDLTGRRVGRLVVIGFDKIQVSPSGRAERFWKCECNCGNVISVRARNLTSGNTNSCGCLKRDLASRVNYKHGKTETRLYRIWHTMKKRCYYPKHSNYVNYGGRGITICEEWKEFDNFCLWALSHGYKDGMTIERIDNNSSYRPENCKWIPQSEQSKNRRNSRIYTYNGETMHLADWARKMNISYSVLYDRLDAGMPFDEAVTIPVKRKRVG